MSYLNDAKAKHRCRNIANPHTRKCCHAHTRQQDGPGLRARLGEHERGHHLGDVVLAQRRGDGEAAEQKHDDRRPHGGEDVGSGLFGGEAMVGAFVGADDAEDDNEEGDEEGGYEEGNGL